jgi:hypothetical protein
LRVAGERAGGGGQHHAKRASIHRNWMMGQRKMVGIEATHDDAMLITCQWRFLMSEVPLWGGFL